MNDNHLSQIVTFPTRFRSGQKPSLLDLVLLHDELLVQSLDSLPGIGKSDHVILAIVVQFPAHLKFNQNIRFNFHEADFTLINSIIESVDWEKEFTDLSCDDALEVLHCFLITICHNLIPQYKPKTQTHSRPPWFSREIKKLMNKKKRKWDTYKKYPTDSNHQELKLVRNSLTAIIRKKKTEYECSLVKECRSSPKRLFSYINSKKKTQPLTCLKKGNNIINDDLIIAEELSTYFQTVFSSPSNNAGCSLNSDVEATFFPFFTEQDVFSCLTTLDTNSSAGPDGIHPQLLKHCALSLSKPLFLIFCSSLRSGVFPSQWKDAHVIPLHKGGSASAPENYRPISLLSSLSKVFEKIIAKYLTSLLSKKKFIHSSQHGFVKGKSCLTNLLAATDHWSSAIDNHHSCDVIYLDFSKAFDTVDHSILLTKLQKLDIPLFLLEWFRSYLSIRRFRVSLRGSLSTWAFATSGVPQGSVLGPTLFNIFINDLPSSLRHSFCLLFADDLKIYRIIRSAADTSLLQSDLNTTAQWAKCNRMSFNISKSAVLHIGTNNPGCSYFLNSQQICPKDSVKDLGILVDNKLKFHQQSTAAAKKAITTANWIFKSFSFLNRHLFSTLFKVFIRPNLEYCIQAWRPHLKKSINILEKTQRKITKWCPGLSHLSYESRLRILNLPTLTDRYNRGDMIETFKLLNQHYTVSPDYYFTISNANRTRGHSLKLALPKFRTDTRKFFFSNRIIQLWNRLPEELIASSSINQWKARYSTLFPDC
jgi:hypothetical protein